MIVEPIPEWLHRAEIPPAAFVVVLTRGHQHDLEAMRALAARDLRYLGLIGSRAKVARIYDALLAEGMPIECLERVHAPIGFDIGAVTPGRDRGQHPRRADRRPARRRDRARCR